MNLFITGSTGFIGRHLVKHLGTSHRVHCPGREFFKKTGDEELSHYMQEHEIDAVIHLATYFVRDHSASDLKALIESNILLGLRLLEALKPRPAAWFINTGTALQHTGENQDEPYNLYAATKASFEAILKSSSSSHVTLKLFETYGPADTRDKILTLIDRAAKTSVPLRLSPGEQVLDLTHIDDVISAFEKVLELTKKPELMMNKNFGVSGTRVTLRELVSLYERATGNKVPAEWGSIPYRKNEVMNPWRNFESLPGYSPRIPLESGIQKTFSS